MTTQDEIEARIRANFPRVFGEPDSGAPSEFEAKFDALVESAKTASEPILTAETLRYQSILIYWSLIMLTLLFFNVGKFKIGEELVAVDKRLFLLYTLFLLSVIFIFVIKSYVDYQRNKFTKEKTTAAITDLERLVTVSWTTKIIQGHFWDRLVYEVGKTYAVYEESEAEVRGTATPKPPNNPEPHVLDLAELKKTPELAGEIEMQERFLASLLVQVKEDEDKFKREISALRQRKPSSEEEMYTPPYGGDTLAALRRAFDGSLDPWLKMRGRLISEALKRTIALYGKQPEFEQLSTMGAILRRAVRIRKVYGAVEVAVPVCFCVFSILLVWFPRGMGSLVAR